MAAHLQPTCWQGCDPPDPQDERSFFFQWGGTHTVSRAVRVDGQPVPLKLSSIQPSAWLYLRKLFFLQSHEQWTVSCLFKARLGSWSWPDTFLHFPYAHLNILPKLISLFLKPSIHVGQALSACAVRSRVCTSVFILPRGMSCYYEIIKLITW
jgi:hypothetical protein